MMHPRWSGFVLILGLAGTAANPAAAAAEGRKTVAASGADAQVRGALGAAAYSRDGKWLAVGGYRQVWLFEAGGTENRGGRIVSPSDAGPALRAVCLKGAAGPVASVAFSPDGRLLAAAGGAPGQFGEIQVWDTRSRRLVRKLRGHGDAIYGVAFSPDGQMLAAGSYDRLVSLWSVRGGAPRMLKDHIDAVYAVAFSPDGRQVASAAGDRTVKVWDVATGLRAYTLSEPTAELYSVVFSPDGRLLAAAGADRMLRVWNVTPKGGALSSSAFAHEGAILRLAFSPDGGRLVSSGEDRWVKVWDLKSFSEERVLERQPDWAPAIALRPDGRRLAVGRQDGTMALYDPVSGEQIGPSFRPSVLSASPQQRSARSEVQGAHLSTGRGREN